MNNKLMEERVNRIKASVERTQKILERINAKKQEVKKA